MVNKITPDEDYIKKVTEQLDLAIEECQKYAGGLADITAIDVSKLMRLILKLQGYQTMPKGEDK